MKTAIAGSSASGLFAALLLARAGHDVTVLERDRLEPAPDVERAAAPAFRPYHPWWVMIAGPRAGSLSAGLTRRDAAMTEFTLGARASCSDGACGVVSRTILDPAARTVTHLVIEHQHGTGGRGRKQVAIPVSAVASVDDGIRLNITKQQVEDLPPLDQPG